MSAARPSVRGVAGVQIASLAAPVAVARIGLTLVPVIAARAGAMVSRLAGLLAAVALVATLSPGPAAAATPVPRPVTFDLYRPGTYSMQASWAWCTAASVQIMRNIVLGQTDHSTSGQSRFFAFMHSHNQFQSPNHAGVDPVGFQAGLRQFLDPRYRIVANATYDAAVREAVTRLRLSGMPVALLVDAGRHAWVLTGFTTTADPLRTTNFSVFAVRIMGPLYGRQNVNGYDPPPDTSLSYAAFRQFLIPYRFRFAKTPWSGRYVTFELLSAAVGGSGGAGATVRI